MDQDFDRARARDFMGKLVGDVGTAIAAGLLVVGDRVGLFRIMRDAGPLTAGELVARTGLQQRYVEEWLAAMACAGYLDYAPDDDRFTLPPEHAVYLSDPAAETYLGGLFASLPGFLAMVPRVAEAVEAGEGIEFADFGPDLPAALAEMNRPVYESRLIGRWLPTMPDVVRRLEAGGRAIDVGCGTGSVAIMMARAFPNASISGLDRDSRSIRAARSQAAKAGVDDRIEFIEAGAESIPAEPGFDLVTTFDCVHDLADPVAVLRRIRSSLRPGGTYLMVEPRAADRLADDLGNPFAKMLYGISCLHCVPQSLAQGGAGLGACWGEARARSLAEEAGFARFDVLPISSPAQAFYALGAQ